MAQNKNSFVIYTNWKNWLKGMSYEQIGKWIMWVFDYCNDENPPLPEDEKVYMAALITKEMLKEDLKKWEKTKTSRSDNGKKGMDIRWGKSQE